MRTTSLPFDLLAWCRRMSSTTRPITGVQAADMLGISVSAYRALEKRCADTGEIQATYVKMAQLLEAEKKRERAYSESLTRFHGETE